MFILGIIFLIIGSVLVYGTKHISVIFDKNKGKSPLIYKTIGLLIAVIGVFMILYGDFPKGLDFIKIF